MNTIINLIKSILIVVISGLILFLIQTKICTAEEMFFSYGLGVFNSAKNNISEVKTADFGFRKPLVGPWSFQFKAGAWLDGSGDKSRSSSLYVSAGPQYIIDFSCFEIRNGVGVTVISNTDSYLGGHLQFNSELYFGVRNKNGAGIGIEYSHFSSAGIYQPNIGKDFILLQISERF